MTTTSSANDPRTAQAIAASDGLPLDKDNGVIFEEPWQATAFALTLALHEKGLFTWDEWAQSLSAHIREAQACGDPDRGNTYYQHWLAALESLSQSKQLTDVDSLRRYRHAWVHAADRTPHGMPIELQPEDFHSSVAAS